jgi:hypothetical protein
VASWSQTAGIDVNSDVSVASRPLGGATVLGTPLAGGRLIGMQLNHRMGIDPGDLTKVPIANAEFTNATISYVQNNPVTVALADGAAYIHMLDDDLQNPQFITRVPANVISEPTFINAGNDLIMTVGADDGLWMYRFQDSLEPIDSKLLVKSDPVLGVSSLQLGDYQMTAFTTANECHLLASTAYESGAHAIVQQPCANPRLSVDASTGDANLLFDSRDGVRMMPIHITMFGGDAPVLRRHTSSPRTVFDGERFWISYIDERGDIVAGFLDANRHPVTMALEGARPTAEGYDLAIIEGAPTIFALDDTGYSAYRLCVAQQ